MENGPFEDVFPIKHGDIPASYVSLPEGKPPPFGRIYFFVFVSKHPNSRKSKLMIGIMLRVVCLIDLTAEGMEKLRFRIGFCELFKRICLVGDFCYRFETMANHDHFSPPFWENVFFFVLFFFSKHRKKPK